MMRHTRIDPSDGTTDSGGPATSVRDRMSAPAITIPPGASVGEAAHLMARRRVHYLPVVAADGTLIGIVNLDDVLGARHGPPPPSATVASIMSSPAVAVAAAVPLSDAARLLAARGVGALPVIDERGRVVGILTQSDVVNALAG